MQNNMMDLGAYHVLIILAALDGEIVFPEMEVLNKFIKDPLTKVDFDPEERFNELVQIPKSQHLIRFQKAMNYIEGNYSKLSGKRLYELATEMIQAKGFVNENELELCLKIADAFDLINDGYSINVPINWSKGMRAAFAESERLNQQLNRIGAMDVVDNNGNKLTKIKLSFASPNGKVDHEIFFDGSKLNYVQAGKHLKGGMDHIKNIAKQKAEYLLESNFSTINGKDNIRFSFLDNEVLYFVISDMRTGIPILNYVGCNEWDYHLEERSK